MKKIAVYTLIALVSHGAIAGEIKGRVPDNIGGQVAGGSLGFLVGGALGGPLGALALGAVSSWAGGYLQQASGLSGDAYEVAEANGKIQVVRSPNRQWQPGDRVSIKGNRLIPQPQ